MKTLVAYHTKHGCTAEAARLLADSLQGEVTLCNLTDSQPALGPYGTVVLGGSVYIGRLPKALKAFCEQNQSELAKKRLGLFVCCSEGENTTTYLRENLPQPLVEKAQAASFGGQFHPESASFFERLVIKAVEKASKKEARLMAIDEQAIARFAQQLAEE